MKLILALWIGLLFGLTAYAGDFELSGSFSYNESHLSEENFQWSRQWKLSLGYYVLGMSEVEASYQDVVYHTQFGNADSTTYYDRIYSLNWVQSFTSRQAVIQPFLRLGAGQLNRDAQANYQGVSAPAVKYDALTVVLGAGVRIPLLGRLNLEFDAATYLLGGVLSTWRNNVAINSGLSIYF